MRADTYIDDDGMTAPEQLPVAESSVRRGSRVRLAPTRRGDVLDTVLRGKVGRVERIDQDSSGECIFAVVLEDDPGRDLGQGRFPGHRFFFRPDEVVPLDDASEEPARRRILVAGIGNVFLGDDGFGVEVVKALAGRGLPAHVEVVDFGIRGMDLVHALQDGHDAAILVDTLPLDRPAGTVRVLRPHVPADAGAMLEMHGMDPVRVLAFARRLGPIPEHTLVVGCTAANVPSGDDSADMDMELSAPVRAAVSTAADIVVSLVEDFLAHGSFEPERSHTNAERESLT